MDVQGCNVSSSLGRRMQVGLKANSAAPKPIMKTSWRGPSEDDCRNLGRGLRVRFHACFVRFLVGRLNPMPPARSMTSSLVSEVWPSGTLPGGRLGCGRPRISKFRCSSKSFGPVANRGTLQNASFPFGYGRPQKRLLFEIR